jgi:hypothetical protein
MKCDLKIVMQRTPEGQEYIEPETIRLLTALAEHKKTCIDCSIANAASDGKAYCQVSVELFQELLTRPDVSTENIRN